MRYGWRIFPALDENECCSAVILDQYDRVIRSRRDFMHERFAHEWIDEQVRQLRVAALRGG